MKGFKGFNKQLQCTPQKKVFQYEIGKEYSTTKADLCREGFHFCENPLDVLRYYGPDDSRYAEINAEDVSPQVERDSKRVSKKLKVVAEMTLGSLIETGVKYLLDKKEEPTSGACSHAATSGACSPAATSGNSSPAATSGDYSPAATSGACSHAATSGMQSIAAAIGQGAKAKAALGSWIVLAEYGDESSAEVLNVKTAKVDGEKIKADTFYRLKNGEFVTVYD